MLGTALRKIVSKYSASYLTGEQLAAPGKPIPQPIGWAPGRTPPPQAPPAAKANSEGEQEDAGSSSRPMSGRALSQGASRPPPPSLATVPEHQSQESITTPTK